jgi:hypothetical protein
MTADAADRLTHQYRSTVERLYAQSEAAVWQLSRAAFAEALERSFARRFDGAEPAPDDAIAFLESLHVENLALAAACIAGNANAWQFFIKEYPLTLDPRKLGDFLDHVQAKGGGEWEEDTYGAVDAAVERLDWKPFAKKVIVLVVDLPPEKDDFTPLLALIRKFKADNGTFNTVDVSQQEHKRFERAFWLKVHKEEPPEISPLPEFYRQTRSAYELLASAGGGVMKSLAPEGGINEQVMILVFGDAWQSQVTAFSRGLATSSRDADLVIAK